MLVQREKTTIEYPDAIMARHTRLRPSTDQGTILAERVARALGTIAKGCWVRWEFTDTRVAEHVQASDVQHLDEPGR